MWHHEQPPCPFVIYMVAAVCLVGLCESRVSKFIFFEQCVSVSFWVMSTHLPNQSAWRLSLIDYPYPYPYNQVMAKIGQKKFQVGTGLGKNW